MKKIATGRVRREQRQKEAAERVAAYQALSPKERLAEVSHRRTIHGGESKREVARLAALIAEGQPA